MKTVQQKMEIIKKKETVFLFPPKDSGDALRGLGYELQYGAITYLLFNDGGITPPEAYIVGVDISTAEVPTVEELLEQGYSQKCYTPNPFL